MTTPMAASPILLAVSIQSFLQGRTLHSKDLRGPVLYSESADMGYGVTDDMVYMRSAGQTMPHAASRHIAIWIDGHQALLVLFGADQPFGSLAPTTDDGRSQYRIDARRYLRMKQYYDAVLTYLEPGDEVLLLGPDEAKHNLRQLIERYGGSKGSVVGLYHASRLAEADLVFPTGGIGHGRRKPSLDGRILQQGSSPNQGSDSPKGKLKGSFIST